jgi:AraC-like DNA-binding protein
MGRFVVSEYIRIEVFRGIAVSAENTIATEDFSILNPAAQVKVKKDNSFPSITALYREQFHSTSFVLGERDTYLEMVFRLHPDNFLFDLEGQYYQIHILFEPKYFARTAVFQEESNIANNRSHIPQNRPSIPQNLKQNFYQPLYVSCESQAALFQLVRLELMDSVVAKSEWDFKFRIQMESIAIRLLMDCLEVSERVAPLCDACGFLDKNESSDKILDAMNFIQRNFRESITIPQIAKEVGINQCYLKKGFKEMYGKTIYNMVQSLRMELAHEILKKGSLNILEVALEVGYTNAASFSTAFKQFYGYSPQQLRTK